jgi:NTE family protein
MMEFPKDADLLYALQDMKASPADFARASMSIPLFFKPFRLPYFTDVPGQDNKKRKVQVGRLLDAGVRSEDWRKRNGYTGVVPEEAMFADGGMLSNFPIRLFHEDWVEGAIPLLPTIGVQLGPAMFRTKAEDVSGAAGMFGSLIDTARVNRDRKYVKENLAYKETVNPAYKETLAMIDCSKFDWLDFDMKPEKRQELLMTGMRAAAEFLQKWIVTRDDVPSGLWTTYKEKRRLMPQKPADGG